MLLGLKARNSLNFFISNQSFFGIIGETFLKYLCIHYKIPPLFINYSGPCFFGLFFHPQLGHYQALLSKPNNLALLAI